MDVDGGVHAEEGRDACREVAERSEVGGWAAVDGVHAGCEVSIWESCGECKV